MMNKTIMEMVSVKLLHTTDGVINNNNATKTQIRVLIINGSYYNSC